MTEREHYAEDIATLAMRLVIAVHDEGPQDILDTITAAHRLTPPHNTNPTVALAVALAAMVDPDASITGLLEWTHNLDPNPTAATNQPNALGHELALAGKLPLTALDHEPQLAVVDELLHRGWTTRDIADHTSSDESIIAVRANTLAARRHRARTRQHNTARRKTAA